jgi:hypothetical protein
MLHWLYWLFFAFIALEMRKGRRSGSAPAAAMTSWGWGICPGSMAWIFLVPTEQTSLKPPFLVREIPKPTS